jgi:hypothetical protein
VGLTILYFTTLAVLENNMLSVGCLQRVVGVFPWASWVLPALLEPIYSKQIRSKLVELHEHYCIPKKRHIWKPHHVQEMSATAWGCLPQLCVVPRTLFGQIYFTQIRSEGWMNICITVFPKSGHIWKLPVRSMSAATPGCMLTFSGVPQALSGSIYFTHLIRIGG